MRFPFKRFFTGYYIRDFDQKLRRLVKVEWKIQKRRYCWYFFFSINTIFISWQFLSLEVPFLLFRRGIELLPFTNCWISVRKINWHIRDISIFSSSSTRVKSWTKSQKNIGKKRASIKSDTKNLSPPVPHLLLFPLSFLLFLNLIHLPFYFHTIPFAIGMHWIGPHRRLLLLCFSSAFVIPFFSFSNWT